MREILLDFEEGNNICMLALVPTINEVANGVIDMQL